MSASTIHTAAFPHICPQQIHKATMHWSLGGTCLLWNGWFHAKRLKERGCVKNSQLSVKSYLALLINTLIPYWSFPDSACVNTHAHPALQRLHTVANTSLACSVGRLRDRWWWEWKMRCYEGKAVHERPFWNNHEASQMCGTHYRNTCRKLHMEKTCNESDIRSRYLRLQVKCACHFWMWKYFDSVSHFSISINIHYENDMSERDRSWFNESVSWWFVN